MGGSSAASVRYKDGAAFVPLINEIYSTGMGTFFAHSLTWTNHEGYTPQNTNGQGMVPDFMPAMKQADGGDTLIVIGDAGEAFYFDKDGSNWDPRHFGQETLEHDATNGLYLLKDTTGNEIAFHDFDASNPANQRGLFEKLTDPDGNVTDVISRNSEGLPTEIQRSVTEGSDTTTESFLISHVSSGVNQGLVEKVTLRRKLNAGSWETVRYTDFAYYTDSDSHGSDGDLKTATIKDDSGTINTYYLRYYEENDANGFKHGLKYMFRADSYDRLAAAYANPLTATDVQAAPYADAYFEYDDDRRVTKLITQSDGSSYSDDGLGTYTYTYHDQSSHAVDYNNWKYKTTETLPDGNQNIVYMNGYGQLMLHVFKEGSSEWKSYTKYDSAGRIILEANPSAVSGYNESKADLMDWDGDDYVHLRDSDGLVFTTTYYSSTTATETSAGGVTGYIQDVSLQHGESGTAIKQSTAEYYKRTVDGATVVPIAESTVYRNTDGTGAQTVSYDYTWFTDSLQYESMTVSMPALASSQNGAGTSRSTTYYDTYGRPTWHKDGDGYLSYFEYDPGTSALTKVISDVDTSETTDFSGLPNEFKGLRAQYFDDESLGNGSFTRFDSTVDFSWGSGSPDPIIGTSTFSARWTGKVEAEYTETYTFHTTDDDGVRLWVDGELLIDAWTWSNDTHSATKALTAGQSYDIVVEYFEGYGNATIKLEWESTSQTREVVPESQLFVAGEHLITEMEVDGLGRETKLTLPEGNITYTTYDDPKHEVRIYAGWDTGTNTPTEPTVVIREDRPGSFFETITMSATPAVTSGVPTGAESISNIETMSRTYVSKGGQVSHADVYHDLTSVTDDFDRANSDSLGSDWTEQVGDLDILSNELIGNSSVSLATHTSTLEADVFVQTDVALTGSETAGLVARYAGTGDQNMYVGQLVGSAGDFTAKISKNVSGTWTDLATVALSGSATGTLRFEVQGDELRLFFNDVTLLSTTDTAITAAGKVGVRTNASVTVDDFEAGNLLAYRTQYGYDDFGRPDRVEYPTGTIERTVYDGLSRVVSTWVGTDDTPTTGEWSPTNNTGANMIKVATYEYDDDGVGDSNLTELTEIPGGSAADRVTEFYYDWRNRLVATKGGVQTTEGTGVQRPIIYTEYDNLSQPIATEYYDGDNVSITYTDDVPDKPSSTLRRGRTVTDFDDWGRVYQTHVYSVNQSTGALSTDTLDTDLWYDHRGYLIKVAAPGQAVEKMVYDGAGREVMMYYTDGRNDSNWGDATEVDDDRVLSQTEIQYDGNSNPIFAIAKERFHNISATSSSGQYGELGDPSTLPYARISYVAYYYDEADRLTDVVNVGTNGGSSYTRPSTPDSRSDTVLRTSYTYNSSGWVEDVTDPRDLVFRTEYDYMGRTVTTYQGYTNGTPSNTDDRKTEYTYDGNSNLLTVKAHLVSGSQTTEYVYGVTTGGGSEINSNDVLAEVKYPDPSTGSPSTTDKETYEVNALGEVITFTDRNDSEHDYTYDVLGRPLTDVVDTLGSNVDGTIRRIETAYDTMGRAYLFTSYDAETGGNVVNEVQRDFNGLSQIVTEYQAHGGAVNTGTSPKVQYAYSEMASGANHSRITSLTYPNGQVINYEYTGGYDGVLNDIASRVYKVKDGSTQMEVYEYIGLGTVIRRGRPYNGTELSYEKRSGESDGDAGDKYIGLDRFGRIVDQRWVKSSDGTAKDRFQYGYDRNSNRMYADNLMSSSHSELYHANGSSSGYDSLDQLSEWSRGTLNGAKDTISSASRTQSWSYDAQGNWTSITTDTIAQNRTHNKQNEATVVGGNNLTYDSNGNMTTDETGLTLEWDAWNRLIKVKSGETTVVHYEYDALNRRIEEKQDSRDLYYSVAWQVLEEHDSGTADIQYLWSPIYVDAMILRDWDTDANGSLDGREWVQQDANWNVTAIVSNGGTVVERYIYDPFGAVSILDGSWNSRGSSSYNWTYLFQGRPLEGGTGLYHFRNREHSPSLGRFVSVDPIGFAGGYTNLYVFVGNGPSNYTDAFGLQPVNPSGTAKKHWTFYAIRGHGDYTRNEVDEAYLKNPNFSPFDKRWYKALEDVAANRRAHITVTKFRSPGDEGGFLEDKTKNEYTFLFGVHFGIEARTPSGTGKPNGTIVIKIVESLKYNEKGPVKRSPPDKVRYVAYPVRNGKIFYGHPGPFLKDNEGCTYRRNLIVRPGKQSFTHQVRAEAVKFLPNYHIRQDDKDWQINREGFLVSNAVPPNWNQDSIKTFEAVSNGFGIVTVWNAHTKTIVAKSTISGKTDSRQITID